MVTVHGCRVGFWYASGVSVCRIGQQVQERHALAVIQAQPVGKVGVRHPVDMRRVGPFGYRQREQASTIGFHGVG